MRKAVLTFCFAAVSSIVISFFLTVNITAATTVIAAISAAAPLAASPTAVKTDTADQQKMIDDCTAHLSDFNTVTDTHNAPGGSLTAPKLPSDFSKAAAEMIAARKTDPLDRLTTAASALLNRQAPWHIVRIKLFDGRAYQTQIRQLHQTLSQAESFTAAAHKACRQIRDYLENYPQQDWESQFGQTGFYNNLNKIERDLILLDAMLAYYQACETFEPAHNPKNEKLPQGQIDTLLDAAQNLRDLSPQWSADCDESERLWQIRLARILAANDSKYLNIAKKLIADPPVKFSMPDSEMQFRLENLTLRLSDPQISRDTAATEIAELKKWFLKSADQFSAPSLCLIQIPLLTTDAKPTVSHPNATQSGITPSHLAIRDRFETLRGLPQLYPPIESTILLLAGEALAETFENPKTRNANYPWDDFELAALGDWYQSNSPPRWDQSLAAYGLFFDRSKPDPGMGPYILYQKGNCHYHLSQSSNQTTTSQQALAALQCWDTLAREFPAWRCQYANPIVSSESAIQQAAALACQIAFSDTTTPDQRAAADQALQTLVGTIAPGQSEPASPFAGTEQAKFYRYYYALSLLTDGQYQPAKSYFQTVPTDNKNKLAARYYAVLSDTLSQTPANKQTNINELADLLTDITKQNSATTASDANTAETADLAAKTMILAGKLCLESQPPRPDDCLTLFDRHAAVLKLNPGDPANPITLSQQWELISLKARSLLLTRHTAQAVSFLADQTRTSPLPNNIASLALSFLNTERDELLTLHVNGNADALNSRLAQSIPLAQACHITFSKNSKSPDLPAIQQSLLELYALAATTLADAQSPASTVPINDILNKAKPIADQLAASPDMAKTLAFVRCRAMLAFAAGDDGQAQKLFYQIRQAADGHTDDPQLAYYWWESRYFGLYCLFRQGQTDEAKHAVEVLQKTIPANQSPWQNRIDQCLRRFCP